MPWISRSGRARAGLDVGPPVAVDGDVLDREGALTPDAGPVADLRRVDRSAGRSSCRDPRPRRRPPCGALVCRRGRRVTHTDLPCWPGPDSLVTARSSPRTGRACPGSVEPVNTR